MYWIQSLKFALVSRWMKFLLWINSIREISWTQFAKKFSWCSGYHNLDSQDSLHSLQAKSPWTAMSNSPGGLISRWMKFLLWMNGMNWKVSQFREFGFAVASGVIGALNIVSDSSPCFLSVFSVWCDQT